MKTHVTSVKGFKPILGAKREKQVCRNETIRYEEIRYQNVKRIKLFRKTGIKSENLPRSCVKDTCYVITH